MEIRPINSFKEIENIYRSRMRKDFPANELTPLPVLSRYWREGKYQAYGFFDDEELMGYAFFIRLPDGASNYHYLFDYFAIADGHRNEGLGARFLSGLPAFIEDASCIIGEVEDPDKAPDSAARELRIRRARFYERNRYLITDVTASVFGADYRLVEVPVGEPHSEAEILAIYTAMYEQLAPKWFLKKYFRAGITKQT